MSTDETWNIPYAKIGAGAVVLKNDCVLLVQPNYGPAKGLWILPGGRVEAGEILNDGLKREVREETGLEVVIGPIVGFRQRLQKDGIMDVYFMFKCEVAPPSVEQIPVSSDPREILAVRFWPIAEALASPDIRPTTRTAIELAISCASTFNRILTPKGAPDTDYFYA